MADIVIRPSMKFIKAGYVITLLVVAAGIFLTYRNLPDSYPTWLPSLWLILLIIAPCEPGAPRSPRSAI